MFCPIEVDVAMDKGSYDPKTGRIDFDDAFDAFAQANVEFDFSPMEKLKDDLPATIGANNLYDPDERTHVGSMTEEEYNAHQAAKSKKKGMVSVKSRLKAATAAAKARANDMEVDEKDKAEASATGEGGGIPPAGAGAEAAKTDPQKAEGADTGEGSKAAGADDPAMSDDPITGKGTESPSFRGGQAAA